MTDDSYVIENYATMSYREFTNSFLPYHPKDSVEIKMRSLLQMYQGYDMWDKLIELDIFNPNKIVGLQAATPAQILEKILADSWTLSLNDKDMIVMCHKLVYELNGKKHQIDSKMVCIGENQTYTAMAKTVGLPVAMATLLILNKKIKTLGVQLPVYKEVYLPILKELAQNGIFFNEQNTTW